MKTKMEVKNLNKADETRKFAKGHLELVKVGGSLIASPSDTEQNRIC